MFHIIGAGYVAQVFDKLYPKECVLYSRNPEVLESKTGDNFQNRIKWNPELDLSSPYNTHSFFSSIIESDTLLGVDSVFLITFPVNLLEQNQFDNLKSFIENSGVKVLILGSWGSFVANTILNPMSIQQNQFKIEDLRNQCEQKLSQVGATRILLAGIYGPNRDPLNWLAKGLISARKKGVHLIHASDIVEFCRHIVTLDGGLREKFQNEFLLSDGVHHLWDDLEVLAKSKGIVPDDFERKDIEIKRPDRSILEFEFQQYFQLLGWHPSVTGPSQADL